MYIPWHQKFVLFSASLWAGVGELLEEWVFQRALEVLVSDRRREIWVGPAPRWTTSVLSHKSGDGDQLNRQCGEEEGGHVLRAAEVTETSTYKNSSPCLPWQISKMFFLLCSMFLPYTVFVAIYCSIQILVLFCLQQGLIQSGERRLCIRPLLQKHIDHLKDLTMDLPSGVPHLLLTHTLPVRTRLKQPKSEWTIDWLYIGLHISLIISLSLACSPQQYILQLSLFICSRGHSHARHYFTSFSMSYTMSAMLLFFNSVLKNQF